MFLPQSLSFVARWRFARLLVSTCLLLFSFFLLSCSGLNFSGGGGSTTPTPKPKPSLVALTNLHWCNKPFIVFRDLHAPVTVTSTASTATATAIASATATTGGTPNATSTASPTPSTSGPPTTITDWSQVEPNLGFSVFLPKTQPAKTCLVSASGTVHDPTFGGDIIIGYLLPDGSPLSFSEAPLRSNSRDFQCTSSPSGTTPQNPVTPGVKPSPTQAPILICTGAKDNTNVVFSLRGNETSLKQFFDALQPGINWVPAA